MTYRINVVADVCINTNASAFSSAAKANGIARLRTDSRWFASLNECEREIDWQLSKLRVDLWSSIIAANCFSKKWTIRTTRTTDIIRLQALHQRRHWCRWVTETSTIPAMEHTGTQPQLSTMPCITWWKWLWVGTKFLRFVYESQACSSCCSSMAVATRRFCLNNGRPAVAPASCSRCSSSSSWEFSTRASSFIARLCSSTPTTRCSIERWQRPRRTEQLTTTRAVSCSKFQVTFSENFFSS